VPLLPPRQVRREWTRRHPVAFAVTAAAVFVTVLVPYASFLFGFSWGAFSVSVPLALGLFGVGTYLVAKRSP
jgi:hypothetical protein